MVRYSIALIGETTSVISEGELSIYAWLFPDSLKALHDRKASREINRYTNINDSKAVKIQRLCLHSILRKPKRATFSIEKTFQKVREQ